MSRTALSRTAVNEQLAALGLPPYPGPDEPAALRRACLDAVQAAWERGIKPGRVLVRGAVRALLDRLAEIAPGRTVEVRIPPYAAVQVVAGPRHTRGTPPNVIEMDAATWIRLGTGQITWAEALSSGQMRASGQRADLSGYLPLV
jgi:uncharacterized SCP-like protein